MNRLTVWVILSASWLLGLGMPGESSIPAVDVVIPECEWTLRIHSKGELVSEHVLDPSNADDRAMRDSIESWLKKSDSGRLDLNSYAPSVVIESDLHKIQFGVSRVIISSRATKDKTWNQKSRPANDEDKKLRDQLTAFAQAKK